MAGESFGHAWLERVEAVEQEPVALSAQSPSTGSQPIPLSAALSILPGLPSLALFRESELARS